METWEQEQVDQYMCGYCMFMAAALHHNCGYPIALMTITFGGQERLSHAWVVHPKGKHLDIQGFQTLKQVTSFSEDNIDGQKYTLYCPTDLATLERFAGIRLPADEPDVVKAFDVAKKMLSKEIAK